MMSRFSERKNPSKVSGRVTLEPGWRLLCQIDRSVLPRMLLYLGDGQSPPGICHKDAGQKALALPGDREL